MLLAALLMTTWATLAVVVLRAARRAKAAAEQARQDAAGECRGVATVCIHAGDRASGAALRTRRTPRPAGRTRRPVATGHPASSHRR